MNQDISEQDSQDNKRRERIASASKHRSGGTLRIFQRLFKKQESAEEQIARLQREVAEAEAAAVTLKQSHDRLVARVADTRDRIANSEQKITILSERREESARWSFNKITSASGHVSEILRWTTSVTDIDGAIAQCRALIDGLQKQLVALETELAEFERVHADDLSAVEG